MQKKAIAVTRQLAKKKLSFLIVVLSSLIQTTGSAIAFKFPGLTEKIGLNFDFALFIETFY